MNTIKKLMEHRATVYIYNKAARAGLCVSPKCRRFTICRRFNWCGDVLTVTVDDLNGNIEKIQFKAEMRAL